MYYFALKLELNHFLHGKLIVKVHLKTNSLNNSGSIDTLPVLKPKILDFFEETQKSNKNLTPFQLCCELVNLLRPYCWKSSVRIENEIYKFEK